VLIDGAQLTRRFRAAAIERGAADGLALSLDVGCLAGEHHARASRGWVLGLARRLDHDAMMLSWRDCVGRPGEWQAGETARMARDV
jgi:hypothetical protein